ncbi:MAG TPA: tripartite tricarboxylate transporter substrate-binding protein, partial [Rhabdaerophilum sp.]|nr:tripartite tricarboxylate transporter substrate-binding protein [Rhabdaerophilum sp.]
MPFAAGGANDIAGRAIADHLSKTLGQSFVVENRPGAGGALGVQGAARSDPDGYTL